MKKIVNLMVFMFVLGILAPVVAIAEDDFVSAPDHATFTALYKKQAAEQTSLINQHERMKNDSAWHRMNPSATAKAEMARHCEAIIEKAKALKAELEKARDWHEAQA